MKEKKSSVVLYQVYLYDKWYNVIKEYWNTNGDMYIQSIDLGGNPITFMGNEIIGYRYKMDI
ncbi:MAG: hypothetical protein H8E55_74705 [Pelagibacterales bacterium]|nr:hypothetical protein [Pelagibacterales bacterium]